MPPQSFGTSPAPGGAPSTGAASEAAGLQPQPPTPPAEAFSPPRQAQQRSTPLSPFAVSESDSPNTKMALTNMRTARTFLRQLHLSSSLVFSPERLYGLSRFEERILEIVQSACSAAEAEAEIMFLSKTYKGSVLFLCSTPVAMVLETLFVNQGSTAYYFTVQDVMPKVESDWLEAQTYESLAKYIFETLSRNRQRQLLREREAAEQERISAIRRRAASVGGQTPSKKGRSQGQAVTPGKKP